MKDLCRGFGDMLIYALSVLSLAGSRAALDEATLKEVVLVMAFQLTEPIIS